MTKRTEVFWRAPELPEPDKAFYTITAADIGQRTIRTTIGSIDIADVENLGIATGLSKGTEVVRAEDVGRKLYGYKNLGFSGPEYYWDINDERH